MIRAMLIPDDALLCDVARLAAAENLILATNGSRDVLCREIPPGWHRCAVVERDTKPH